MALWKEIDPELKFSSFNIFEDEAVREGIKSKIIKVSITLWPRLISLLKLAQFPTALYRGRVNRRPRRHEGVKRGRRTARNVQQC